MCAGGITGSLTRFFLSFIFPDSRSGTLAANLIGVCLAAYLLVLMERKGTINLRHFLLPGFCGGLTTFSALTLLTLKPSNGGFGYLLVTLLLSLAAIAVVIPMSQKLIAEKI